MITTENYRNDYVGDATTASYDFTFKVFDEAHLQVVVNNAGTETTLVLDTDYSVEDIGEETGNIVLLDLDQAWLDISGFLDTGIGLTIIRDIPLKQETDFRNQGEYYAEGHEDSADKQVMMLQQMQSSVDRCLKAPVSDPVGSLELPTADERANGYLGFDADGEPMVVTSAISSLVTVSAFMETVLDDASATAARTTLGFAGTGGTAQAANIEADAVTTAKIIDGAVTNAKLSDMATQTIKGRTTAGTGAPEDLTVTQVQAMMTLPTQQKFTSGSGTYTTPANCRYIKVRMVGGGGSGAGGGIPIPTNGTAGNATTFGTLSAGGGSAGNASGGAGGAGGTNTFSGVGLSLQGGMGGPGAVFLNGGIDAGGAGGSGGSSFFGGAGAGGHIGSVGQNGAANTGGGGGGGGHTSSGGSVMYGGSGGGSGGFIEALISSPDSTYSYAVGAAQTSVGSGTTAGANGGQGADGIIVVEEYY